jgi:hypothetical protein
VKKTKMKPATPINHGHGPRIIKNLLIGIIFALVLPAQFPEKLKARSAAPNCVETVLGVRGFPKSTLPKSSKNLEIW